MSRRKKYAHVVQLICETSPDVILKAAALCDGHSILKPEAFTDAGLHNDVVEYLTATYKSDGTPKGTIYVAGKVVEELQGVYGLEVLKFIAGALGVEYEGKFGRGSQAEAIKQALHRHFSRHKPPTT